MASFEFDQAEGLRRMLAGPKPRVFTFLSATSPDEKGATLVNLAASLVHGGSKVLLLDACGDALGVAARLGIPQGATLLQVARQERALEDAVHPMPQGFGVAALSRGIRRAGSPRDPHEGRRLSSAFSVLARHNDIVLVEAVLGKDDALPMQNLVDSEIVVHLSADPRSITSAYSIIKKMHAQLGRRPFSVLVTGADDKEAQIVFKNMAQAAERYLAIRLRSIGSVPPDDHVKRAAKLGRTVIDAFPLAGASVAFRRLAERFAVPNVPVRPHPGMPAMSRNYGT